MVDEYGLRLLAGIHLLPLILGYLRLGTFDFQGHLGLRHRRLGHFHRDLVIPFLNDDQRLPRMEESAIDQVLVASHNLTRDLGHHLHLFPRLHGAVAFHRHLHRLNRDFERTHQRRRPHHFLSLRSFPRGGHSDVAIDRGPND